MTFQKFLKLLTGISLSSTGAAILLFISFVATSAGQPIPVGNGLTIFGLAMIGAATWMVENFLSMYSVRVHADVAKGYVGKDVKSESMSLIRRKQIERRRRTSSSPHIIGGRPWW